MLSKFIIAISIKIILVYSTKTSWYKNGVFYHVYVRSFKDSDNDGIGDLRGVIEKLDHLYDLGVTVAWLSPIFKSPQVDHGYDISDYYTIDPIYGNMNDLTELLMKAEQFGIKILLDLVPNHTSDRHHWFGMSVNCEPGYEDFYVWIDPSIDSKGNRLPPNNWVRDRQRVKSTRKKKKTIFSSVFSPNPHGRGMKRDNSITYTSSIHPNQT